MDSQTHSALDMLETALKMEEKGQAFYGEALKVCQSPQVLEIFSVLLEDEKVHMSRIRQIYASLTTSTGWPQDWEKLPPRKELEALFRDLAAKTRNELNKNISDLTAIGIALEFEQASILFYQDHRARTTHPTEAAFLDQMVLEEKAHWRALEDTRYLLTDPEGWFMEKERAGLDGAE
jgi:rubrerythrin